ncbi:hypothetical protein ACFQHW_12070 [Lapidilactobacillus achengensis]|uniref:ABC transporter permease n=1 Tax=Lapidilactobacillus achengensis TaxID=2486000 RepID=A0ABW1UQS3_9LACO|nr:hypothetical protein [Lapidilactobacillus achengensis]
MIKLWRKYFLMGLLLISMVTVIHTLLLIHENLGILRRGEAGTALFYGMQLFGNNETIWHLIIMLVIIPTSCFWFFIYGKNSKLFNLWVTRVGRRVFIKQALCHITIGTAIIRLVQIGLELMLIHFLFAPISLIPASSFLKNGLPTFFTLNGSMNLLLFVLCSTVGWVIGAILCFAVSLFVRRTVLIFPATALLLLLFSLLPGIANVALGGQGSLFLYTIFLPGMIAPGEINFGTSSMPLPLLALHLLTVLFYMVVCLVLLVFWQKQARQGDA